MQGKHRDYEPFEMGENMEEDLGMFEAACASGKVKLDFSPVSSVMTILDGSNQESTCRQLGVELAKRLATTNIELTSGNSLEELVRKCDGNNNGLILLPVPCGEDIGKLSCHSLGSAVDNILQTCQSPILCVRDPLSEAEIGRMFDQILVVLMREDHRSAHALAWAFRLASSRSRIRLLELADRSSLLDARRLLEGKDESGSIEEATIGRAVASRLGGLIGAAQQHASQKGLSAHVDFRLGNPVKETLSMAESLVSGLIIIARSDDHTETGFHFVQDVLLATRKCVLVV
jgi:hypothetical protein